MRSIASPAISRRGHTLMELTAATVASAFLMAGLGGVMMIARQVAYTPTAANERTKCATVVNQIAEELRYATLILQHSAQTLEFVVADRNADGTAERIRYEWSGVTGDPLFKTVNSEAAVAILDSIDAFTVAVEQTSKSTTLTSTVESAEAVLASNTTSPGGSERALDTTRFTAQKIDPTTFSVPAGATSWNATKVQFYGDEESSDDGTLLVQLRAAGDPNNGPTSDVLGQRVVAESLLSDGWNTVTFSSPCRNLGLYRSYAVVWAGSGIGDAAALAYNDNAASGVLETTNAGASWTLMPSRQVFYRLFGTINSPGSTYTVTRTYVPQVSLLLQSSAESHSRIDARIPLNNLPELLTSYWRADFSSNPTSSNFNGDAVSDWAFTGGTFSAATLINGVWNASGMLSTRPLNNFTTNTIVEASCRNTTVGGNGAVLTINADRQGGQYAPLMVNVQRQSDGSQTLTLYGKTSDSATKLLCSRSKLSSGFIRFRLTIVPQSNVVNLAINDEDQGTFVYPTYAPSTSTDAYVSIFQNTSLAEFDYVDVRVN
jgi:hypothetical protein